MSRYKPKATEGLSARELAGRTGVSINTVRYYQFMRLLHSLRHPHTGRRFFDPSSIERMKLIRKLNRSGYTLRAIREIFACRWH